MALALTLTTKNIRLNKNNREKKTKSKRAVCVMLCKQPLFCTKVIVRRVLVWRGEAEPLVKTSTRLNAKFNFF